MVRQVLGSIVICSLYVLCVLLNVWLTGFKVEQPGGHIAREYLREGRSRPVQRVILVQAAAIAVWACTLRSVDNITHHYVHLSAPTVLVAAAVIVFVVATPIRNGVLWLAFVAFTMLLGWWVWAYPGTLTLQLVVLVIALAFVGKPAKAPVWWGGEYPRFSLISVPMWLTILVNATLWDMWVRWTDLRAVHEATVHGTLSHVQQAVPPGQGSIWHAAMYAHQYYSLGLATPVVAFIIMGIMVVWSHEYTRRPILWVAPLVCLVVGLGSGLVVSIFTHGTGASLASPYMAVGLILGILCAAYVTELDQLLLGWYQGFHGRDETHKLS